MDLWKSVHVCVCLSRAHHLFRVYLIDSIINLHIYRYKYAEFYALSISFSLLLSIFFYNIHWSAFSYLIIFDTTVYMVRIEHRILNRMCIMQDCGYNKLLCLLYSFQFVFEILFKSFQRKWERIDITIEWIRIENIEWIRP